MSLARNALGAAVGAAGAATSTGSGCGVAGCGAAVAGAAAGAPSRLTPQLEQKASPTGFVAPQEGHICVPAAAGAAGAAVCTWGAALASGVAPVRGSPHSSQKAEPSGFSCPREHLTVISIYPSSNYPSSTGRVFTTCFVTTQKLPFPPSAACL